MSGTNDTISARVTSRVTTGKRKSTKARRRSRAAGSVATLALFLAAWVGSLSGSGAFNSSERFDRKQLVRQSGNGPTYEVPRVPDHPGSVKTMQRQDLVRAFISLDGIN